MRYPFQSTGRPISHWNVWLFRVYMIPLRDFVPEGNSRPGTTTGMNSPRGDSRQHDILWWYHVNKCINVQHSHDREPEWNYSGAKVASVSCKHPLKRETSFSFRFTRFMEEMFVFLFTLFFHCRSFFTLVAASISRFLTAAIYIIFMFFFQRN